MERRTFLKFFGSTSAGIAAAAPAGSAPAAERATADAASVSFTDNGRAAPPISVRTSLIDRKSIRYYGAVGNGRTDESRAFALAKAVMAEQGGGTIKIPVGTWMVDPNSDALTFTANNVALEGDGHFATIVKAAAKAAALVTFHNVARITIRDMQFDADAKCANTHKFVAARASSCGSMLFENLYLTGALTDTVNIAAAGAGSPNDVSHITWNHCYLRSKSPSNSQLKNSAANGLCLRLFGGIVGGPGASPFNVDLVTGQLTTFDTYFQGATSYDVQAGGGQWQSYGGRSESVAFFHSLHADTAGPYQAPHLIRGLQGATSGGDAVLHEAQRALQLDGNFWGGNVRVGNPAAVRVPESTCYAIGVNAFLSGRGFVVQGSGRLYETPLKLSQPR